MTVYATSAKGHNSWECFGGRLTVYSFFLVHLKWSALTVVLIHNLVNGDFVNSGPNHLHVFEFYKIHSTFI